MFRQGQLAVHRLAILLGRIEAGISNRGKKFLHHAVYRVQLHRDNSVRAEIEILCEVLQRGAKKFPPV